MARLNFSDLRNGDVLLVHGDEFPWGDQRTVTGRVVGEGDMPKVAWDDRASGEALEAWLLGTLHQLADKPFTLQALVVRGEPLADGLVIVAVSSDTEEATLQEVVAVRCFELWRGRQLVASHLHKSCAIGSHDR